MNKNFTGSKALTWMLGNINLQIRGKSRPFSLIKNYRALATGKEWCPNVTKSKMLAVSAAFCKSKTYIFFGYRYVSLYRTPLNRNLFRPDTFRGITPERRLCTRHTGNSGDSITYTPAKYWLISGITSTKHIDLGGIQLTTSANWSAHITNSRYDDCRIKTMSIIVCHLWYWWLCYCGPDYFSVVNCTQ